jgi:hypothetical protein
VDTGYVVDDDELPPHPARKSAVVSNAIVAIMQAVDFIVFSRDNFRNY